MPATTITDRSVEYTFRKIHPTTLSTLPPPPYCSLISSSPPTKLVLRLLLPSTVIVHHRGMNTMTFHPGTCRDHTIMMSYRYATTRGILFVSYQTELASGTMRNTDVIVNRATPTDRNSEQGPTTKAIQLEEHPSLGEHPTWYSPASSLGVNVVNAPHHPTNDPRRPPHPDRDPKSLPMGPLRLTNRNLTRNPLTSRLEWKPPINASSRPSENDTNYTPSLSILSLSLKILSLYWRPPVNTLSSWPRGRM